MTTGIAGFARERGLGPKLMTEEEWKEHRAKMQTLTGEQRERYRRETHEKMRERAKERGLAMPTEPGLQGRRSGGPGWAAQAIARSHEGRTLQDVADAGEVRSRT